MGFFTDIFGGSRMEQLPGAQPYIDRLYNFDPTAYGLKLGLGQVGKAAKADFQALRSGKDISSIAGFNGELGAINSAYNTGDRERNRETDASLAFMNQPALAAAQKAALQNQSNQDRSNTIAQAAGGFYDKTANTLNNAFQASQARRLAASGQKLQADQGALSGYLSSFYQKNTPGLLNQLGGAASSLGNLGKAASAGTIGLFGI